MQADSTQENTHTFSSRHLPLLHTPQCLGAGIAQATQLQSLHTGLLLHYKSHVDDRYKRGLLKTMLDRAFRLSSNWNYFCEECDRLKLVFSRLKYPDNLINSTISQFVAAKASDQPVSSPAVSNRSDPIRVVLPFKDQASADIVRSQLKDLIRTSRRPYSRYLLARGLDETSNCEKLSRQLWTNSALFTNLNVTCEMLVMLVSHAVIFTNLLTNTKALHHQLASIFETNILWFQRISQRTSAF